MMNFDPRFFASRTALLVAVGVVLSGCGDTKRQLGLEKQAPDEFQVVSRAPLSSPPDYNLRPPTPGSVRPQEGTTSDRAKAAMLGAGRRQVQPKLESEGRSSGEMALLQHAGAQDQTPGIRNLVNEETLAIAEREKTFTEKMMFWGKPAESGEVIDATKEAQRLRQNQALGKNATEGNVPVIKRKPKGLLEDLVK
jgi:hypothetical protein